MSDTQGAGWDRPDQQRTHAVVRADARERLTARDIEDRLGLDHLDELLAERARLVGLNAQLGALYGSFGTWDAQRKQFLSVLAVGIRQLPRAEGERAPTDKAVDELAHADARYQQFIAKSTTEKAQYLVNEDAITAIDARIHSRQAMLRFAANEINLR
jgi:hypothetical protein